MIETKEIKKPWCICIGIWFRKRIGKIIQESEVSATVIHAEDQWYPPRSWDKNFLERFETLEEAVEKLILDLDIENRNKAIELTKDNFPSLFKEDSV